MKKKILSTLTIAFALTGSSILLVSSCNQGATCEKTPHWTYLDIACWSENYSSYATCGTGTAQSPIDLVTASASTTGLPTFTAQTYAAFALGQWDVKNNGHTIQFTDNSGANSIQINGVTYTLNQFHFHTLSEHTIDGKHYAMEMHMVHTATDGSHAVVGIMLDDSTNTDSTLITNIKTALSGLGFASASGWPSETEAPDATPVTGISALDYTTFSSALVHEFVYTGSLTTPPCTENVSYWVVGTTPLSVTTSTVADFKAEMGGIENYRPVQPLNGRTVYYQ